MDNAKEEVDFTNINSILASVLDLIDINECNRHEPEIIYVPVNDKHFVNGYNPETEIIIPKSMLAHIENLNQIKSEVNSIYDYVENIKHGGGKNTSNSGKVKPKTKDEKRVKIQSKLMRRKF